MGSRQTTHITEQLRTLGGGELEEIADGAAAELDRLLGVERAARETNGLLDALEREVLAGRRGHAPTNPQKKELKRMSTIRHQANALENILADEQFEDSDIATDSINDCMMALLGYDEARVAATYAAVPTVFETLVESHGYERVKSVLEQAVAQVRSELAEDASFTPGGLTWRVVVRDLGDE